MRHIPLRGWWRASCAARMVGPNLWQVWISRSVGEGSEGLKIWKLIKNQGRVVSLTYVLGPHGEFFSWCSRFLDSWGCWNTHKNLLKKVQYMDFPYWGSGWDRDTSLPIPWVWKVHNSRKNSSHFEPQKKLLGFCGCFTPDFQVPNRFCRGSLASKKPYFLSKKKGQKRH